MRLTKLYRFHPPPARLWQGTLIGSATALLLAATGGCAFLRPARSESHYYLLTAASAAERSATGRDLGRNGVVRLRPVEVADYLRTREMAVRTGTNEVKFELFHRWAEPLEAGIRRVLVEDLGTAPGIGAVLTDQPASAHSPFYAISVRVLACEGAVTNGRGSVIFEAAWKITRPGPDPRPIAHGVFRAPRAVWQPGDYGALAGQLSRVLSDFSRVLGQAIRQAAGNSGASRSSPHSRGRGPGTIAVRAGDVRRFVFAFRLAAGRNGRARPVSSQVQPPAASGFGDFPRVTWT